MSYFRELRLSIQADINETAMREAFALTAPLRTLLIYDHDPAAPEIPQAVAAHLQGEVWPGEVSTGPTGAQESSATLATLTVPGGRVEAALSAIGFALPLFAIETIAIVHPWRNQSERANAGLGEPSGDDLTDLAGNCFREGFLVNDAALLRAQPGIPAHVKIVGFSYDVDRGALAEIVAEV